MVNIFGISLLSSIFEIHMFILGITTGIIAHYIGKTYSKNVALLLIFLSYILIMTRYSIQGWEIKPWYFTSGLAIVLFSLDISKSSYVRRFIKCTDDNLKELVHCLSIKE